MSFKIKAEGGARAADRDEIRRALSILIDPAQATEVIGLPSGHSRACHGSDLDAATEAAYEVCDGAGTYYRINPCRPGLSKSANNGDIIARRWLLVDCDPVRPDKASATDGEKAAGIEQARATGEFLASHGWPDPLWVDSGNGVQLLYRIDLPAEVLSRQWLKAILARLGDETDTAGSKIDRGVHRANQLAKLPGTWARKGDGQGDRPHRMARLVSVPPTIEVVTAEQLGAMAGADTTPKGVMEHGTSCSAPANGSSNGHTNGKPWQATATRHSLDGYVRSAIRRECAVVEMTPQGDRNNALNTAAFNLGTMASWPEMNHADAKIALYQAAKAAGLDEGETAKTISSGWDSGAAKGRARPAMDATRMGGIPKAGAQAHGAGSKPIDPNKRLIRLASEINEREVKWLWPNRIPVGKLTIFAGWGGLGKSFVTMDLAARISKGLDIPGMGGECFNNGTPGKVLILNTEDDPEDTSRPRLRVAGADLTRVAFAQSEVLGRFTLGDLATLDQMLGQFGGADLLVIDPATAHLGGVNADSNAELRELLMPLSLWAMDRSLAVVLVSHVNKPQASKVEAMARVVGSVAWVNAVRAAVMFARDPKDRNRRLFIPFKSNNAPEVKGLSYRVVPAPQPDEKLARIEWLGEVDTSADEALSHTSHVKQDQELMDAFLRAHLAGGEKYGDETVDAGNKALGTSKHRNQWLAGLNRVNGYSRRIGFGGRFMWGLNPPAP